MVAYKARDKEKLAASYTEDACVKVPGHPDACGRSGIEQTAQDIWSAFPNARTAWSRAWLMGDVLGVESTWTGTNDGAMGSLRRPTHKTVGAIVLTLSWLAPDGRIREQHVYGDAGLVASELAGTGPTFEGLPTTRGRHEARGTPVEEGNLEVVRGLFASPPAMAAFAGEADLADPARAPSQTAKTGAARWIGARTSGLSKAHVVVTHAWGAEDSVLCEYEATGIQIGRGPHAEAVTIHGAEVFSIDDGKVTRAVRYRDSLELSPLPGLPPPLPSMAP
jgi:hypothetical protein